jgi:hypothetical protein
MSYIMCNDWDRGIFLVDLNLQSNICIDVEHRRLSWILGKHHIKIAMITNVLLTTRKVLAGTSF